MYKVSGLPVIPRLDRGIRSFQRGPDVLVTNFGYDRNKKTAIYTQTLIKETTGLKSAKLSLLEQLTSKLCPYSDKYPPLLQIHLTIQNNISMRRLTILFLGIIILLSQAHASYSNETGSSRDNRTTNGQQLVFIIIPVENVSIMYEKFLPLKEYLEKAVSRRIVLKIAQNYQEAIDSIGTGQAHLAYLDPSSYCEARHMYNVIPIAKTIRAGASTYRSVIAARKDSMIERIVEARGKRLALGNKSSSSSYLIPAVMFKEVGINLKDFDTVDFLEEEDRIALSILAKRHDIGGLSERVASKYIEAGLKIIKISEAIPQYSICAYKGLPADMISRLKKALFSINEQQNTGFLTDMKDIDGFAPAKDRDFDVVRVMIKNLTGKNYLEYGRNSVKVAILPLYSAITLFDRFDPLMRYLSKETGREFKLVIPRDFEDFFDIVRKGKVEYSYSNPYIYIQLADKGYIRAFTNTIKPPTGDIFRGIIITHRDSDITALKQLKGKDIMIVSPRSAGGFLAQKLFLLENGIDVNRDLNIIDGKRQENVILNVYRKKVDAGFVRESALNVLKEEIDLGKIRVLARTPYIPNWPFAYTKKADPDVTARVRKSLVGLKDTRVLSAAQIEGFKKASDNDFDKLRKWIRKHDKK
ncbi:tetrathionate sensor histidine kinase TtrS [bacterium BMS3Abin07]|nr:tetrathionate sensor histidine kinase TtrS [bacterium BMS3Abin07]GBE32728.1 tetrathionate sensor histidine kinase TtrS [bacterium BMS3Bbin05]